MSPMAAQASAAIGGRSFDLTASVTTKAGDEGVLYAVGAQTSGLSIFVQGRRLVLDYNAFGDHTVLESSVDVPVGDADIGVRLRRGDGLAGTATLVIDGEEVAHAELALFLRMISSSASSVGSDHGSAVSPRYTGPFPFTGELHQIVIQASPERFADIDEATARAEASRQ
jgi:arylsulfatase